MKKQSGLNFSTVAHCILDCSGKGYTIARMRQWICDDVGNGMACDPSDFSNSINKGKPIVGFAYDYYENAQNLPTITASVQKNVIDVVLSITVLIYNNLYLTLFTLYGFRTQYESSKKLYEAKKASTGTQEEAYLMQMKKEQLDDLREWDLKARKYCGEKLEQGQQYCALNNELYNDLYGRAMEEFAELEQIYQQCKAELNRLMQTASYGALMKIKTKGKHSKGKQRSGHRKK